MGYSALFFGSGDDFNGPWPPVHSNLEFDKIREFCHFWPFSWAVAHCFCLRGWFRRPVTPGTRYFGIRQNSLILSFLAVYTVIWKSSNLVNFVIYGRLHSNLEFDKISWIFSFLAISMGYSALFLAPGTISTARDPRYTVIWRSEEHTSELQSLRRISYAVFCLVGIIPEDKKQCVIAHENGQKWQN